MRAHASAHTCTHRQQPLTSGRHVYTCCWPLLAQAGLCGAAGLTCGLLLETTLLIIRTNRPEPLEERMPDLFDPAKVQESFRIVERMRQDEKKAAAEQRQRRSGGSTKGDGKAAVLAAPAASAASGSAGGGGGGGGKKGGKGGAAAAQGVVVGLSPQEAKKVR